MFVLFWTLNICKDNNASNKEISGFRQLLQDIDLIQNEYDSTNLMNINLLGSFVPSDMEYVLNKEYNKVNLSNSKMWYYEGSLTTPGCHEIVRWHVFDYKLKITNNILESLRNLNGSHGKMTHNWRPIQKNDNPVYVFEFKSSTSDTTSTTTTATTTGISGGSTGNTDASTTDSDDNTDSSNNGSNNINNNNHNNNNSGLIVVIIILTILFLLVLGYLVYTKYVKDRNGNINNKPNGSNHGDIDKVKSRPRKSPTNFVRVATETGPSTRKSTETVGNDMDNTHDDHDALYHD